MWKNVLPPTNTAFQYFQSPWPSFGEGTMVDEVYEKVRLKVFVKEFEQPVIY